MPHKPPPASICQSVINSSLYAIFSAAARRTTAPANGCSLSASNAAAKRSNSAASTPSAGQISVTSGVPCVIVPVLSSATICVLPHSSKAEAVLNKMPCLAPIPLPTMIATGVARPSAHGQLITSTDMARASAKPPLSPKASQTAAVTAAITSTAGTKTPATLSASLAMGALVAAASLTMRIICASVVSSPTRVARQVSTPLWLSVAAATAQPAVFSTGTLSPVSAASFTAALPLITSPSTGIYSPGRTTKTSPKRTSATETCCSTPPRSTTAVCGDKRSRLCRASVVRPLARASNILPSVISVKIIAADS